MIILDSKYGEVKIYAETIEQEAISQITNVANSSLGENANIRIMPDAHAGAACVIGTTMKITDKVCPNLVGVDIGCGVDLVKTDINFSKRFDELDNVIRTYIPFGMEVQNNEVYFPFEELYCWNNLSKEVQDRARKALGTLGSGNHFIEAYEHGFLAVHSGSRNIGLAVAKYYQTLAEKRTTEYNRKLLTEEIQAIPPKERENWIKTHKISIDKDLCYLTGIDMQNYLHDVGIMQKFAVQNRQTILFNIVNNMNGTVIDKLTSTHNYIDLNNMILRKGAISAQKDELLVIPLNMRDGVLICRGKGNEDWNYSAPHGAGRLYSRSKAKELFSVEEYAKTMKGIFSTCISESTLDEAPFAYKNYEEIIKCIEPTVEIIERLIPIYNFKAN